MSKITNIILGVFLLYTVNTNGQQIIADTVSSELSPGQSMEVYSRQGVTLAPGFYAPEGSFISVGEIDTFFINTENLDGNYLFDVNVRGVLEVEDQVTGGIAYIVPVFDNPYEYITLSFNDTSGVSIMTLELIIDSNYQVTQVEYLEHGTLRKFSTDYYDFVFPDKLHLFNKKIKEENSVRASGVDGLLKIAGEDIVLSGLERFSSWVINIFSANDHSTPVRVLNNVNSWNGNDSNGNPVSPGVYIIDIDADYYEQSLNFSMQVVIE